jgi:uncharacterized integral membrane protein
VATDGDALNRAFNALATDRLWHATNASCWHSTHGSPKRPGMQFLKTLFWVLIAVLVALFATRNWSDVTLNLWDDIQADIKLPVMLLVAFLLGWLPTWLWMRTRIWGQRRRIDALERNLAPPVAAAEADREPVI